MPSNQFLCEVTDGESEPLTKAARRFSPTRQNRPVTLSCLFRWITRGVKGPDGERVKLEAARLAGRWITTPGAIKRFISAQTPPTETLDDFDSAAGRKRTTARRERDCLRADRKLAEAGI
jgi:hypothetical protein